MVVAQLVHRGRGYGRGLGVDRRRARQALRRLRRLVEERALVGRRWRVAGVVAGVALVVAGVARRTRRPVGVHEAVVAQRRQGVRRR